MNVRHWQYVLFLSLSLITSSFTSLCCPPFFLLLFPLLLAISTSCLGFLAHRFPLLCIFFFCSLDLSFYLLRISSTFPPSSSSASFSFSSSSSSSSPSSPTSCYSLPLFLSPPLPPFPPLPIPPFPHLPLHPTPTLPSTPLPAPPPSSFSAPAPSSFPDTPILQFKLRS